MTLLKVRGRIVSKFEKLNPSLKAGGCANCHRTIPAPCTLRTDRKSPVQMLSGRWREEETLLDLGNNQSSVWYRRAAPGTADSQQWTLLQQRAHIQRHPSSQFKSFRNSPKYPAKSLEQQLPSQPSEITFHTLRAEGEPRAGGAAGVGQRHGVPSWVPCLCDTDSTLLWGLFPVFWNRQSEPRSLVHFQDQTVLVLLCKAVVQDA